MFPMKFEVRPMEFNPCEDPLPPFMRCSKLADELAVPVSTALTFINTGRILFFPVLLDMLSTCFFLTLMMVFTGRLLLFPVAFVFVFVFVLVALA